MGSEEFVLSVSAFPMFVGFLAYPVYSVGVICYITSVITGDRIDTVTAWKLGIKFWNPYLALTALVGITVMFGLILLIVPGIILSIRYSFSGFDLLLNNSKPIDAMKNSWNGTKDYFWLLLGGYAVITVGLYAPYVLISSSFDDANIPFLVFDTTANLIYAVLGVLNTIFAFRIYDLAREQRNLPLKPDSTNGDASLR